MEGDGGGEVEEDQIVMTHGQSKMDLWGKFYLAIHDY